MRKWILTAALLGLASAASPVWADYYFRGTPNDWAATALIPVDSSHYTTCQTFGTGDTGGGPRFKIDRYADWSESYPSTDYEVSANSSYRIDFDSSTQAITATQVAGCNAGNPIYAQSFNQLYFRGTPTSWDPTPMTLVANHTWQTIISFDGQSNQRFKFDVNGDWSQNYGDNTGDGMLELDGGDIYRSVMGDYLVTVNDQTLTYSLEAAPPCTSDCSTADTLGAVYSPEGTTFSLWSPDSSDVQLVVNGQSHTMSQVTNFSGYNHIYQVRVPGDLHLAEYHFLVSGIPVRDPYGKMAAAGTGDTPVNIVMDMSRTEPVGGWAPRPALANREDAVIYELNVRDFTIDPSAGVSAANRGKFLGLVEPGTTFAETPAGTRSLTAMTRPGIGNEPATVPARTRLNPVGIPVPARSGSMGEQHAQIPPHASVPMLESQAGNIPNRGGQRSGADSASASASVQTGIDHLKELGITHVQLMPVYDFATCDGLPDSDPCYNWGYDPRNYNVPEDRYSTTPTDYENRAREFKTMVNEFHKAGIRVIMDVVYNHTYGKEMFENITPSYYNALDLTATGNAINADVPMVNRMIQDSLEYWVREYGVDGFRFDLVGVFSHDVVDGWGKALNSKFPDRNLLLYGEPWNGYAADPKESQRVRYGTTRFMAGGHVGVFNGAYREAIKGNNDGIDTAYMFNNVAPADAGWAIYDGFRGSPYDAGDSRNGTWFRNYTADPEQSINYISAHDNFDLWDKVYLSLSSNVTQSGDHQVLSLTPPSDLGHAKRVVDFGMGMVLTSQGIPFIHSGDEFLRTKTNNEQMSDASAWNYGQYGGAHNSYNAPDSFNSIKWHNKADNAATFSYLKALIALRRAHAGLRMTSNQQISQSLTVARPGEYGGQVVTGYIDDPADSSRLFVVYNSGDNQSVALPSGSWTRIADAGGAANEGGLSGTTPVEGTAVTVFSQLH